MMTRRLQHFRSEAALSIRDLAKLAGISTATIVKAEHGESVYPSTVRKLAAALEVTPRELMGDAPARQARERRVLDEQQRARAVARLRDQAEQARQRGDVTGAAQAEAIAAGMDGGSARPR